MNRIQFQPGLSLPAFLTKFGTDEQCADALEASRWPQCFCCPDCGHADYYLLKVGKHKTFQCKCCRLQTSLIAGTLFQSTHLALSIWFLAIYLVSQAKTGLSALDLKRQLGVSYPTAWLIQQKLMQAMVERDAQYTLYGNVQADDAYLGGELAVAARQVGVPRTRCLLWRPSRSVPKAVPYILKWHRFLVLRAKRFSTGLALTSRLVV
jgi:hypothetical protein